VGHHARGLCTLSLRIGLQRRWPKVSHDALGVRSALCEQASLEEAWYHDNLQLFFMADLIDNSESSLLKARSLTSAEELVWRWIYTGSSDGGNLVSLVDGARRSLACLFIDECRSAVLYSCVCLKIYWCGLGCGLSACQWSSDAGTRMSSLTAALKGPVSSMTRVYAVFLSITFLFEGQVCIPYQRT